MEQRREARKKRIYNNEFQGSIETHARQLRFTQQKTQNTNNNNPIHRREKKAKSSSILLFMIIYSFSAFVILPLAFFKHANNEQYLLGHPKRKRDTWYGSWPIENQYESANIQINHNILADTTTLNWNDDSPEWLHRNDSFQMNGSR